MLSKPVATAPPTVLQRFLVCVFYGATSGALSLLMKKLLSRYSFSGFFLLLAAQMGLQLGLCILSRDRMGNPFGVPEYDRSTHQASLRLGVTGVGNVAVGMLGLQLVNIPMFLCIRRLVAPFILMYEALVFGKFASMPINTAVCGILLGTLVAGYETLSSDMLGYMVVVVNNVLSAATSVMQKQLSSERKLDALGVLYYNSMTAFPLSLFLAFALGEVSALGSYPYRADPGFLIAIAVCTCMGPLITYSTILCTTFNSALTTSITGNVKDIGLTIIGALAFGDFQATASNVSGILLSFAGAGLYSWVSYTASTASGSSSSSSSSGCGCGEGAALSSAAAVSTLTVAAALENGEGAGSSGSSSSSGSSALSGVLAVGVSSAGSSEAAAGEGEGSRLLGALEEGSGSGRVRKSLSLAEGGVAGAGGASGSISPERSGMVSIHAGIALTATTSTRRAKGI